LFNKTWANLAPTIRTFWEVDTCFKSADLSRDGVLQYEDDHSNGVVPMFFLPWLLFGEDKQLHFDWFMLFLLGCFWGMAGKKNNLNFGRDDYGHRWNQKNAVVEQRIAGLVHGIILPVGNAKKQLTQLRSKIVFLQKRSQ